MKHFWELLNKAGQTVSKGARHLKTRLPNQLDERSEGFLIAILSAAAGAVVTNFLGAGGQKKENEQLRETLFIEKKKRERVNQDLEIAKLKIWSLEQSQEALRTTNDELGLTLHKLEAKLADILKDNIDAEKALKECQQHKLACHQAFKNSFCFYRQRYTSEEEGRKIISAGNTSQQNDTGGPSC